MRKFHWYSELFCVMMMMAAVGAMASTAIVRLVDCFTD